LTLVNTKLAHNAAPLVNPPSPLRGSFILAEKQRSSRRSSHGVCVKSPSVVYRPLIPSFLLLCQNFAKEFLISDIRELDENYIRTELKKAGGANYDAQAE